jgi:hypothetical protein
MTPLMPDSVVTDLDHRAGLRHARLCVWNASLCGRRTASVRSRDGSLDATPTAKGSDGGWQSSQVGWRGEQLEEHRGSEHVRPLGFVNEGP